MRLTHHDRILRLELRTLRQHEINLGRGTERKDLKTVGMAGNHIQGVDTDGSGGTQNGDALLLMNHDVSVRL